MRVWTKYRLIVTGEEIVRMGTEGTKCAIEMWAKESGVHNVTSGVIKAVVEVEYDWMRYEVYFDSSHWTGIGFKGFKRPEAMSCRT